MESANIEFILRWAILPIVIIVIWTIKRLLRVETKAEVLEVVTQQQEQQRKETLDVITTQNTNVMTRLTSIEEYLRNGRAKT